MYFLEKRICFTNTLLISCFFSQDLNQTSHGTYLWVFITWNKSRRELVSSWFHKHARIVSSGLRQDNTLCTGSLDTMLALMFAYDQWIFWCYIGQLKRTWLLFQPCFLGTLQYLTHHPHNVKVSWSTPPSIQCC